MVHHADNKDFTIVFRQENAAKKYNFYDFHSVDKKVQRNKTFQVQMQEDTC